MSTTPNRMDSQRPRPRQYKWNITLYSNVDGSFVGTFVCFTHLSYNLTMRSFLLYVCKTLQYSVSRNVLVSPSIAVRGVYSPVSEQITRIIELSQKELDELVPLNQFTVHVDSDRQTHVHEWGNNV